MPRLSVVIPTYKRAKILSYVLSALKDQTYKDFEVVIVIKPSGDCTEEIISKFAYDLDILTVTQKTGFIVDAYLLGVKHSKGDIVAFLDDDAIPAKNWAEASIETFERFNVVAVTGDYFSAIIKHDDFQVLEEKAVPPYLSLVEHLLSSRPLKGLENYRNCITDAGSVNHRGNDAYWRRRGAVKALPHGPSMAILRKVLADLQLPTNWILGCTWEMVLGWYLWKKGLGMIYNPEVRVIHLVHGRTASRDFLKPRSDLLWISECQLLFYRLYSEEPQLSIISKMTSDIMKTLILSQEFIR